MINWDWVGRNTDVIWAATWEHIILTVVPVLLGLVIALPLGVYSAVHQYSRFDYFVTTLAFLGAAVERRRDGGGPRASGGSRLRRVRSA